MGKQIVKLDEHLLRQIISEAVVRVLCEGEIRLDTYEDWRDYIDEDIMWFEHTGFQKFWKIGPNKIFDSNGHAFNHLGPTLLKMVLQRVDYSKVNQSGFLEQLVTFPEPVGYQECVETNDADSIIYAQRQGRKGVSRFVLNRRPELCNTVFIVLRLIKGTADKWQVITGYVGTPSGKEPWDRRATMDDNDFWKTHALVSPDNLTQDDDLGDENYWRKERALPIDGQGIEKIVAESVRMVLMESYNILPYNGTDYVDGTPDYIVNGSLEIDWQSDDARPFIYDVGGTLYLANRNTCHSDYRQYLKNIGKKFNIGHEVVGRIWLSHGVMSVWNDADCIMPDSRLMSVLCKKFSEDYGIDLLGYTLYCTYTKPDDDWK